jgi:hypothetical protein
MTMTKSEIELTFKNTALQNLKNILLEADSSAISEKFVFSLKSPIDDTQFRRSGIDKSKLKSIVLDLKNLKGQYISRADLGQIVCNGCLEEAGMNRLDATLKNTNNYINTIVNKIN